MTANAEALELARRQLLQDRQRRHARNHKAHRPRQLAVGDYALVESRRFPSHESSKFGVKYVGPFLVLGKDGRCISLQIGNATVRCDIGMTRLWTGDPVGDTSKPSMTFEEMEKEGIYVVEKIIKHKKGVGEPEFLVQWENYQEPTWEPLSNFIIDGHLNEDLKEYLEIQGLFDVLAEAKKIQEDQAHSSKKKKKKQAPQA